MRSLIALSALALAACAAETFSPSSTYTLQQVSGSIPPYLAPGETITPQYLRLVDDRGAPVVGHPVVVAVNEGGGTAALLSERSGLEGLVVLRWTLGTIPGTQRVTVTPAGSEGTALTTEVTGFNAAALAVGQAMACAIDFDGRAWCWGDGWRDGIGRGDSGIDVKADWRPIPVTGGHHFIAISAGEDAACALDPTGAAWCWGADDNGQLGQGAPVEGRCFTTIPCLRYPIQVSGGHTFTRIVSAGPTTCAVDPAGAVWCWGENERGQGGAGGGSPGTLWVPTRALTSDSTVQLVAGRATFCARYAAGNAECWGENSRGAVGDPVGSAVRQPIPPQTTEHFTALFAATDGFCGVRADGAAWCWGSILNAGAVPVRRPALDSSSAIGGNWFADAWTLDRYGRLRLTYGSSTLDVAGGARMTSIGSGAESGCGLGASGQVWCWGGNTEGELGTGVVAAAYDSPHYPPVPVGGWYPLE